MKDVLYRRVLTQSMRDWTVPKSRKVRSSIALVLSSMRAMADGVGLG
jgi:hypothetical protein